MKRENWTFDYTATRLADASQEKIAWHTGQLAFWQQQREEVMATIRAEGIQVTEKTALSYLNPKARDWEEGGDVVVRNDLRKRLAECFEKLAYHTGRRDQYDGWQQVLSTNPEERLSLDIHDWLFFFGRDVEREG